MKLQLNKKKLKNLSKDAQIVPSDMTPQVGGADGVVKVPGNGEGTSFCGLGTVGGGGSGSMSCDPDGFDRFCAG